MERAVLMDSPFFFLLERSMYETALVYITAPDKEEAEKIANSVITERLAACANILGDVSSIFLWKGSIQNESEIALFLKTAVEKVPLLTKRVSELHSYEEPCIIALPIVGGSDQFLDWIKTETLQQ